METLSITEDAVASHLICHRKSYQHLFQYDEGKEQKYSAFLNNRIQDIENEFFQSNIDTLPYSSDKLTGKAEFIINANIRIGNLAVNKTHLQRLDTKSKLGNFSYEPLLFSSSTKIEKEDRIRASYIGSILHKAQGKKPARATIILINGDKKSIRLDKDVHLPVTNRLNEWISLKPEIPNVIFNKQCPTCPFENRCRVMAEKEDSISLLGNMSPKVKEKFESKGIFTIKQLSYLYKPRRRSRHWGDRKPTHQYELQALALRTQKIYTDNLLELQKSDTEIFVDIESVPDQKFHYLIGVLVSTPKTQRYYPYWAKNESEEKEIWEKFLKTINRYSCAPIFHYGSYEKKVITELANRYGIKVDSILDRLECKCSPSFLLYAC